jgi:hypothetical protein
VFKQSGCGAVGSALDWGSRGRKFKSCHSDQKGQLFGCPFLFCFLFSAYHGLLFFLGQIGIFCQPLGELFAALLRAGFTTDEVKDHLAYGIFFTLEPLYSLAAAAVNARPSGSLLCTK